MALISNNNIARAIYLAAKGKTNEEQSLVFKKVIQFLIKKRLLIKSPNILSCLNKIINDEEGRVMAKVSSKNNLSEKFKQELKHSLAKRYKAKEVDLILNTNEDLLGGYKSE